MPSGALTGFLLGAQHVVQGPDHIAAVAPLAADGGQKTWLTGMMWGVGHSTGVAFLGFVALMMREVISEEFIHSMSIWCERLVGVMLIVIGLWGFRRVMTGRLHVHAHTHETTADGDEDEQVEVVRHVHPHDHGHAHTHDHAGEHEHQHKHTHAHASSYTHGRPAFIVGCVHGLAGGTHLAMGIVPAIGAQTRLDGVTWVVSFGLGSVVAMTAFSWAVGFFSRLIGMSDRGYRLMLAVCCTGAIIVGAMWLFGEPGSHSHSHGPGMSHSVPAEGVDAGSGDESAVEDSGNIHRHGWFPRHAHPDSQDSIPQQQSEPRNEDREGQ